MIHYHGGPIWPEEAAAAAWKAGHACISYARPEQIALAAAICQSFFVDNGAFSFWKQGLPTNWPGFYEFVVLWMNHPGFDFAVIPDVIEGSEEENDALLEEWPFGKFIGAPVWHINESIERFERLVEQYPRVCIGSSGEFDVKKPKAFLPRAREAIRAVCDQHGRPKAKIHGLRVLNPLIFTQLPLASGDSTNIAMNIIADRAWRGTYQPKSKRMRAAILRERIEDANSAGSIDVFNWEETMAACLLWCLVA
jgi:hypothetical protein